MHAGGAQDHPEEAEAIANAGRARIEAMDMDEVARFMYLFLREVLARIVLSMANITKVVPW